MNSVVFLNFLERRIPDRETIAAYVQKHFVKESMVS